MKTTLSAFFEPCCFSLTRLLPLFLPLCFLLLACSNRLQSTPTPKAQITFYPTATSLSLPTATATWPQSSPTPKPTSSPTSRSQPDSTFALPTATAVTGPTEGATYNLLEWSPARVNELDAFLQTYPDSLGLETSPFWGTGEYWELFRLPALIKLEALRRFPTAEDASNWQWSAAYDLGRSDASRYLDNYYPLLLSTALNEGVTTTTELPIWWEQHEPRLTLTLTQLQSFPGNQSNHVLFLDGLGGAYFWLVKADSGFQIYPVTALFAFYEPRVSNIQFGLADITGDGLPEAITIQEPLFIDGRGGTTVLEAFDLAHLPPQKIRFNPSLPDEFVTRWSPTDAGKGLSVIKVVDAIDCELDLVKTYQWNEPYLEIVTTTYPSEDSLALADRPTSMEACVWYAENDAFQSAAWGDTAAMEWIEINLAIWPPSEAPMFSAEPYPPDIRDQIRFRLGVYSAFADRYTQATKHFTTVISNPTVSTTQWITLSQEFLATYTTVDQLARACSLTQICYPVMPLPRLVEMIPADSATPIDALQSFGVPIEAFGSLDFEHDQQLIDWLLVTNNDSGHQTLWLLAQMTDGWNIVRVGTIANGPNHTLVELSPVQDKPVFRLLNANDQLIFTVERDPFGRLLAIEHRTYAQLAYDTALNALILGQPAAQIRDMLLGYGQTPYQDCLINDYFNLCSDLLYLQGLSYELSGDEAEAIATYLQLWSTYPDSPYVFIIRAKLES